MAHSASQLVDQAQVGCDRIGPMPPIPGAKRTGKRVMRVRTKAPSAAFTYDRDGHFSRNNAKKVHPIKSDAADAGQHGTGTGTGTGVRAGAPAVGVGVNGGDDAHGGGGRRSSLPQSASPSAVLPVPEKLKAWKRQHGQPPHKSGQPPSVSQTTRTMLAQGPDQDPNPAWMASYWDGAGMAMLLFCAICTPYEVAFLETKLNALFFVNRVVDLFFIADMAINFVRAYWDTDAGCWISSRRAISRRYLRGWFWLDLLSILPFDLYAVAMADKADVSQLRILRTVRVFRLAKLLRVARASRILSRWEERMSMSYCTLSLAKYTTLVLFMTHWVACAWHIVLVSEDAQENWLTKYLGEDAALATEAHQVYVTCLYFALMTLSTVGYGDITPATDAERTFCVALFLVGGALWAYVVGAVCSIVASVDKATSEFRTTMDELNIFMEDEMLPQDMRTRLRRYFRYSRSVQRRRFRRQLLTDMSPQLRGEVSAYSHREWVSAVPFFAGADEHERDAFVAAIAVRLEPLVFVAGESIIRPHEPADAMYIVKRGEVLLRNCTGDSSAQTSSTIVSMAELKSAGSASGHTEMQRGQSDQVRRMSMAKRGCFFGEDMVAILAAGADGTYSSAKVCPHRCRRYAATAVTYVDILRFSASALLDMVKHNQFPRTKQLIIAHAHSMLGTAPAGPPVSAHGTDAKPTGHPSTVLSSDGMVRSEAEA